MDYPDDATFYVRLSLVQPKEGADEQISAMQDDLLQFFATQPGYVRGYKLIRKYPDPRIGRISVWQSESDADNAASASISVIRGIARSGGRGMISNVEFTICGGSSELTDSSNRATVSESFS